MADLTRDDILKLARLSRIDLEDSEVASYLSEMAEIIKYVELLQSVDTTGLAPTAQVTGLTNVMREDETWDYGYPAHDLMKNVPATEKDQIRVKRMIG